MEQQVKMRPSWDDTWMAVVDAMAERSTCARRAVGCVIVSADNKILATGYNGVASGLPHCNEGHLCTAHDAPSGSNLDGCDACHAEINALVQCGDIANAHTLYVSSSPCVACTKALLATPIRHVVFRDEYSHTRAKELWQAVWRDWRQL